MLEVWTINPPIPLLKGVTDVLPLFISKNCWVVNKVDNSTLWPDPERTIRSWSSISKPPVIDVKVV